MLIIRTVYDSVGRKRHLSPCSVGGPVAFIGRARRHRGLRHDKICVPDDDNALPRYYYTVRIPRVDTVDITRNRWWSIDRKPSDFAIDLNDRLRIASWWRSHQLVYHGGTTRVRFGLPNLTGPNEIRSTNSYESTWLKEKKNPYEHVKLILDKNSVQTPSSGIKNIITIIIWF